VAEVKPELKDPGDNDLDKTDASSLKDESDEKAVSGRNRRIQNRVSRLIENAAGSLFQNPIS
jgi:hypothetical protein